MTTYNVYRDGEKVASGLEEKSYTDADLTPNTEYTYQVSAENSAGESELSESITVTTDYSPVASVAVSPKTNNLEVGATRQLNATVEPSTAKQDVTWSSDDKAIATVDANGKVTAVSEGQATITASAESETDTATVNVTEPVVDVTGVEVAPKTASFESGEAGNQQLTATVSPSDATNKSVTYTISPDADGLSVNGSGNITWTENTPAGEYTVTATTGDGGLTDTHTLTLTEPEPEPEPDPEEPPEEGE